MATIRTPSGFTLIELVITLAVLAVLSTLALPSLGARLDRARLAGAAELLAADLSDARFEAARQGRPLHLVGQAGEDWCWAVATAPTCSCTRRQACQLKTVHAQDHPGVRLLDGFALGLHPGGQADTAAGRLQGRHGERLRVTVSPLGRARICTEAPRGSTAPGGYKPC